MSTSPNIVDNNQGAPVFGRTFELQVLESSASSATQTVISISEADFSTEPLRITFECEQTIGKNFSFAVIAIYNLNSPTEQGLLAEGQQVVLKAGYQNQTFAEIFRGTIFQVTWEREGVVNDKIELHCMVGREAITNNFIAMSSARFSSQDQIIARMAAEAHQPITIQYMDTAALSATKLPRGRVLFGNPQKYIDQAAKDANIQQLLAQTGLSLGSFNLGNGNTELIYGPGTGLVGTPQATPDGVSFRVLLDARIRVDIPPVQVKLDMQAVRALPRNPGDYPTILDQDGVYLVGKTRFVGDSRGRAWYTEVVGYTSVGGKLALMGALGNLDPNAG